MIVSGWYLVKSFLIRGAFLMAGELSEKRGKINHVSRLPVFFPHGKEHFNKRAKERKHKMSIGRV